MVTSSRPGHAGHKTCQPDPRQTQGTPPNDLGGKQDTGYLGTNGKLTDHTTGITPTIDMGARPYRPDLGRFLQIDPVEGGCANTYAYVAGDPINANDAGGRQLCAGFRQDTQLGTIIGSIRGNVFSVYFEAGPDEPGLELSFPGIQAGIDYAGRPDIAFTGSDGKTSSSRTSWTLNGYSGEAGASFYLSPLKPGIGSGTLTITIAVPIVAGDTFTAVDVRATCQL
jgi:RHS repeat-associated protein